jgi:hypothetical protein
MKNSDTKFQLILFFNILFLTLLFCSNTFSQKPVLKPKPSTANDSRKTVVKNLPLPSKNYRSFSSTLVDLDITYKLSLPENWFDSLAAAPYSTAMLFTPDESLTFENIEKLRKQFGETKVDKKYIQSKTTHGVVFGLSETTSSNLNDAFNEHIADVKTTFNFLRQNGSPKKVYINGEESMTADFVGKNPANGYAEMRQIYVTLLKAPKFNNSAIFFFEVFAPQKDFQIYKTAAQDILNSIQLSQDTSFKAVSTETHGFAFTLTGCVRVSQRTVGCNLFTSSQDQDRTIEFLSSKIGKTGGSRIFDNYGNEYPINKLTFGNKESGAFIVADTLTITRITVENVEPTTEEISLIQLWFSSKGSSEAWKIEFRKIPISKLYKQAL